MYPTFPIVTYLYILFWFNYLIDTRKTNVF